MWHLGLRQQPFTLPWGSGAGESHGELPGRLCVAFPMGPFLARRLATRPCQEGRADHTEQDLHRTRRAVLSAEAASPRRHRVCPVGLAVQLPRGPSAAPWADNHAEPRTGPLPAAFGRMFISFGSIQWP